MLFHPKLCKKSSFLRWKKFQPKIVKSCDLPLDAECNICLEKLGGRNVQSQQTELKNDGSNELNNDADNLLLIGEN